MTRSFLPLLKGAGPGHPVFSEELLDRGNTGEDHDATLTSARSAGWKHLLTFDKQKGTVVEEACDLRADPGEQCALCGSNGRIDGLSVDPAFCEAVERARNRIWGDAERGDALEGTPYRGGRPQVTSKRPQPCGS